MPDDMLPPVLLSALAELRADRDAIPWPRRLQLAVDLAKHLAESGASDQAAALATILAQDPHPQVRKEVADLSPLLPEEAFYALAGRLQQDANAFVRTAALRVVARRLQGAKRQQQSRRELKQVESSFASMAKVHGPLAAEKARRLADEQYETLVRATLHDLKNIVSPITMNTATLLKHYASGTATPSKCVELLEDMKRELAYLESFMGEMRNYAQASTAERQRCRIADLVDEAVGMTKGALAKVGIDPASVTIAHAIQPHLTAPVIRHQVVMALIHLIKNACESLCLGQGRQHTGSRDVQITAEARSDGMTAIRIRDSGPGIGHQQLADLREFSLGYTTKREHGGTGFGLPTAFRFATAHGGTLGIESTKGHGTTVTFTLSSGDDESPATSLPTTPGDQASTSEDTA